MRVASTDPLFAWAALEDSPSLRTLREFLATVPDAKLLDSLRRWRGRGRNDYPVHCLWGVVLLAIVLRHSTIEACLGELRRNAALRRLIGIESEQQVPQKWNVSRFLLVLGQEPHRTLQKEVYREMVGRLAGVVKDLGQEMVGDASGLSARTWGRRWWGTLRGCRRGAAGVRRGQRLSFRLRRAGGRSTPTRRGR